MNLRTKMLPSLATDNRRAIYLFHLKNQQRTEHYPQPAIGKTILWLNSTARRFPRRAARLITPATQAQRGRDTHWVVAPPAEDQVQGLLIESERGSLCIAKDGSTFKICEPKNHTGWYASLARPKLVE
jgi:hypothetical protein